MKVYTFITALLFALSACADNKILQAIDEEKKKAENGSSSGSGSSVPQQNVTIQFAAKVGTQVFDCSTASYTGVGAGGGATLVPKDFRFFVHDVRFVKSNGSEVAVTLTQDSAYQYQNLALLDFENAAAGTQCAAQGNAGTNTTVRGTIAASEALTFTKVRFKLGVPQNLNQNGVGNTNAPLNVTYMFWSWTTGYKHAVVEFNVNTFNPFFTHLGSIDCDTFASPPDIVCDTSNRPAIELNFTYGQTVVADAKELYKDTDFSIANTSGTQPGCHSDRNDAECKAVLNNWGVDFSYTGSSTARGLTASSAGSPTVYPTSGQVFFRVE